MIFQDEQEEQVKASIYGEKIPKFLEKYKFELYHSYFITGARVKPSNTKFGALHDYEWVIDVKTIIDPIKENDPNENVLPLPTKLTLTPFSDIKAINDKTAEIDILGIVVNCFPSRYVSMERKLQELIVIDPLKEAFTFTIWEEDIIENEGEKLLRDFKQYPIILARRIRVSDFNGKSFETRFNTTIQINPPYPQCQQLHEWVMENNELLASFTTRSTSKSRSGPLISVPVEEEVVSLANAHSQEDKESLPMQDIQSRLTDKLFKIQAKKSFGRTPTTSGKLYILSCVETSNALICPRSAPNDITEGSKRKKECPQSLQIKIPPEQNQSFKMKKKNGANNSS